MFFRTTLPRYMAIASVLNLSACLYEEQIPTTKESLGEALFNDKALSRDGNQACVDCHDPGRAFIDSRVNVTSVDTTTPGAVSTGQDDLSLGDINTQSAAYTAFNPEFHFDDNEGLFIGGLFLNGRASTLAEQAKIPFTNEVEMQNTIENVVATVEQKYFRSMQLIYGDDIFHSIDDAFEAIADSIAAFEQTVQFAPFDSKFDRYLNNQANLTFEELRGLSLFIDENKGNCAACHPVPLIDSPPEEKLFTDFSYDNLGVPVNALVRSQNNKGMDFIDNALFDNPEVTDPALKGAYRVPSLRNVAVTAPYMHNGVFRDLTTVVQFYNSRDVIGALNPETSQPWNVAEVDATKNTDELGDLGLSPDEVDDIVAFLKTLTDKRYEHLMN